MSVLTIPATAYPNYLDKGQRINLFGFLNKFFSAELPFKTIKQKGAEIESSLRQDLDLPTDANEPVIQQTSKQELKPIFMEFVDHVISDPKLQIAITLASNSDLLEIKEIIGQEKFDELISILVKNAVNSNIGLLGGFASNPQLLHIVGQDQFEQLISTIVETILADHNSPLIYKLFSNPNLQGLIKNIPPEQNQQLQSMFNDKVGEFLSAEDSRQPQESSSQFQKYVKRSLARNPNLCGLATTQCREAVAKIAEIATKYPNSDIACELASNPILPEFKEILGAEKFEELISAMLGSSLETGSTNLLLRYFAANTNLLAIKDVVGKEKFGQLVSAILEEVKNDRSILAEPSLIYRFASNPNLLEIVGEDNLKELVDILMRTIDNDHVANIVNQLLRSPNLKNLLNLARKHISTNFFDDRVMAFDPDTHKIFGLWLDQFLRKVTPDNSVELKPKLLRYCPKSIRAQIQVGLQCPLPA